MWTIRPRGFYKLAVAAAAIWLVAMPFSVSQAQNLAFSLPAVSGEQIEVQAAVKNAVQAAGASASTGDPASTTATAVCFLGTECPMARGYAAQLNALQSEFSSRGVRIIGVMSNRQDSLEDIAEYVRQLQAIFPIVRDDQNQVADRYGAQRTPEVFLLDAHLKLRYHGRIDDQLAPGVARAAASRQDLRIAIEELLAGKPISIPATNALGCIIGRVPSAEPTDGQPADTAANSATYSQQVARVLQQHCIECHRPGEIGPFAMDRYEEVVGWAETMLETVEQGRMPPWHADPQFGSFANARNMPEEDKQVLRDWIAGGLKRGDDADLPAPLEFTDGWNLPRAPDVEVDMRTRPFVVPKDGVVEYQYFVADPAFKVDTWVTAAQVIPGQRSVVHHAIVFVRPPDGSEFSGIGWLTAYVPGQREHALPAGYARKIPAGSKFVFQMHYTPNGVEHSDVTRVGLLTCDASQVKQEVFTLMAIDHEFEIPPGAENFAVQARTQWLPDGAELLAITPHMHFRGKSFRLFGAAGQGSGNAAQGVGDAAQGVGDAAQGETLLLHVPNYDFNWQHTYQLQQPLPLDAFKSGLQFEAVFDNSTKNPFNPDPTQTVTWGDQSWEEMAVAFFEVARPRQSTESSLRVSAKNAQAIELTELQRAAKREADIEAYIKLVFAELDRNGDGQIHKSEADIVVRRLHFDLWDLDDDQVATAAEVRQTAEKLFSQ